MLALIIVLVTLFFLSLLLHLLIRKVAKQIPQDQKIHYYQSDRVRVKNAVYGKSELSSLISQSDKSIIKLLVSVRIIVVIGFIWYLFAV